MKLYEVLAKMEPYDLLRLDVYVEADKKHYEISGKVQELENLIKPLIKLGEVTRIQSNKISCEVSEV